MTDRGADILPTTSLGHYEVRAKIGSGGMGDVFDAIHVGLNKRVAIKTLRKRFLDDEIVVQRFLREGQLASRIRHPNIVDVTDVGMMGGLPCLVMEHLEGESLSALVKRDRTLPLDTIVDLLLPILAAVDFAHQHGVVHRDLKPSNIFLSRSWNGEIVPKVLDFGISKLVHESAQEQLTTDSAFVGTPHYASPELMRADKNVDGRSDQYSAGVILYECAAGMRPFADLGNNFIALAMAICNGDFPALRTRNPNVPPGYEAVVHRAMALDVAQRFPTMRHLGEALLSFASARARMIWTPTFAGDGTGPGALTEVFSQSGQSHTVQITPRHPAALSNSQSYPSGAAITGPQFAGDHSNHPSATPPAMVGDRLPSYGAGTAVPARASARTSGLVTALIALVASIAVAISVVLLKSRAHEEAAPAAATPREEAPVAAAPAAPPASYILDVRVQPPAAARTAVIDIDGVVSTGPIAKTFPSDGQKHVLRISAAGFEPFTQEFDAEASLPPHEITLRPHATNVAPPKKPVGGGPKTKGNSESRPKTDNIDPWE